MTGKLKLKSKYPLEANFFFIIFRLLILFSQEIYVICRMGGPYGEILSERTRMIYGRKYGKIFHKLNNF